MTDPYLDQLRDSYFRGTILTHDEARALRYTSTLARNIALYRHHIGLCERFLAKHINASMADRQAWREYIAANRPHLAELEAEQAGATAVAAE